jgi:arylsulfatase A-like enzyme
MKLLCQLLFFWLLSLPALADQPGKPVNLLVIMTDQQRFDALSAAGNTVLQTPNMDRLANEGVLFENAYTPVPVCAPARTSILTGQSIHSTGIDRNQNVYDPESFKGGPSFDMILSEAGYKTAYYGKWHSPQALAGRYDNAEDYPVTATSGAAGMGTSMIALYRDFLTAAGIPAAAPADLPEGQLIDSYSRRPYRPNPMDTRYGLSASEIAEMEEPSQGHIHGTLLIDPAYSITAMEAGGVLDAIDRFADQPFSLTVSFHYPHPPFTPTEPYASMYEPESMPLPPNFAHAMANSPYADANQQYSGPQYDDPAKVRQFIATYYGLVKEIDDWVGRILDRLDRHGLADRTLVVLVSDHGEMLGSHGMSAKNIFYEESVHVPLLMRLPGRIPAGTRVADPVSTRDIFPTVLDYLGRPPVEGLDSASLRGVIEGRETRDFAVAEWRAMRSVPTFMVRSGDWKLLISKIPDADSVDALYNLADDPYEMTNLLFEGMPEAHARVAAELKDQLVGWLEEAGSPAAQGVRDRKLPE